MVISLYSFCDLGISHTVNTHDINFLGFNNRVVTANINRNLSPRKLEDFGHISSRVVDCSVAHDSCNGNDVEIVEGCEDALSVINPTVCVNQVLFASVHSVSGIPNYNDTIIKSLRII